MGAGAGSMRKCDFISSDWNEDEQEHKIQSFHKIKNDYYGLQFSCGMYGDPVENYSTYLDKKFVHEEMDGGHVRSKPHCPFPMYYPLYFVPGYVVLKLNRIPKHEELIEAGLILKIVCTFPTEYSYMWHDSYGPGEDIYYFEFLKLDHPVNESPDENDHMYLSGLHRKVFFSHRWKQHDDGSRPTPDDLQDTKLNKMKTIVQPSDLVWFDYMCIPQDSQDMQLEAIKSLPHYIGQSDELYILTTDDENREQYKTRAFTNLELVCASIPLYNGSGTSGGMGSALESITTLCKIFDETGEVVFPYLSPAKADMYNEDDREKMKIVISSIKKMVERTLGSLNYSFNQEAKENCRKLLELLSD